MNAVGIVSIVLGVLILFSRGPSLVAPARFLAWFRNLVSTNRGLRRLGAPILVLGLTMIWAGASEESGLANVLVIVGFAFVGTSMVLLLLFPSAYRAMIESLIPEDTSGVLNFIRLKGLVGTIIGVFFVYYGALAL